MNKNYYREYYHLERKHWWFRARMEILSSLVSEKICSKDKKKMDILNTGVATGATSVMLKKFGSVTSLEYDKDCCEFLEQTVKIDVVQGSLTQLPFDDNSFDLVCAFDVVEHIEDDLLAIKEMKRVLKTNGYIFITVPAFNFLWSDHDIINHHFRRYRLTDITDMLKLENFNISFKSYFNFILFLPIMTVRVLSQLFSDEENVDSESQVKSDFKKFKTNSLLNKIFYWLFKKESSLLIKDLTFPFGVSVLVIGVNSKETERIRL